MEVALGEQLTGLVAVGGGRNRVVGFLQRFLQALADKDLVVGDEDVGLACGHGYVRGGSPGRRMEIDVPAPSSLSTSSEPPCWCTTRWAIDRPRPVPSSLVV